MQLKKELRYCQCNDSPKEFRDRLLAKLKDGFPGYTIDSLVCRPTDALRYCEQIRAEIGTESMADAVILKALMNIRKSSNCPTGHTDRSGRKALKTKLRQLGIEASTKSFKEQLTDCLASMYKSRTIDEMFCYPREAMALCHYVRSVIGSAQLEDELILSTMMNVRKSVQHS